MPPRTETKPAAAAVADKPVVEVAKPPDVASLAAQAAMFALRR